MRFSIKKVIEDDMYPHGIVLEQLNGIFSVSYYGFMEEPIEYFNTEELDLERIWNVVLKIAKERNVCPELIVTRSVINFLKNRG